MKFDPVYRMTEIQCTFYDYNSMKEHKNVVVAIDPGRALILIDTASKAVMP